MQLGNTIKNIVKEITRECTNKNIAVCDEFLSFFVELLVLNPFWNLTSDLLLNRNDVYKFVKYCLQKLEHQDTSCIITLKMQLCFSTNFSNAHSMVTQNRWDLKNRLIPLEIEIIEATPETTEEKDMFYKRVVHHLTLISGLGNPTLENVYVEAAAALRSIFTDKDMEYFVTMAKSEKEMQLVELAELVTGIRLFNRDCKKGGEGIEDLPKLLNDAIEATRNDIQKTLLIIMDRVNLLTTAIDSYYIFEESETESEVVCQLPKGVTDEDVEYFKDSLVMYRQYEVYVRKILIEVENMDDDCKGIYDDLQEVLVNLYNTVQGKTAVLTNQVFPLFSKVAKLWCEIQDEAIFLAQLNQILYNLHSYIKVLSFDDTILKLSIGHEGLITDAERLQKTTGLTIESTNPEIIVLYPNKTKNFDKLILQFLGFCPWKLTETHGGLIPGNPNMGIIKYNDMCYAFSCLEAANEFMADPNRCIYKVLDMARNNAELIEFFQLREQLISVLDIGELVVEPPKVIITHEIDVQTELHPVPTKIDKEYMWNIWDWKRQAIMLANLSKCQTVSTQTNKSNNRADVKTQTYRIKDKVYQTKKDNYTNTPTLSNYIYGLRGRKDDKIHVVTLTRPIEE